jgi:hypothetical protein
MKAPANFDAQPVAVSGKLGALRIREYELSKVERSWTKGSGMQIMTVKSEKRRQKYEFHIAGTDSSAAKVSCEFSANERTVGLKGGWEVMAGERSGRPFCCREPPLLTLR